MDTSALTFDAHDLPVSVRWLNPIGHPTFDAPMHTYYALSNTLPRRSKWYPWT